LRPKRDKDVSIHKYARIYSMYPLHHTTSRFQPAALGPQHMWWCDMSPTVRSQHMPAVLGAPHVPYYQMLLCRHGVEVHAVIPTAKEAGRHSLPARAWGTGSQMRLKRHQVRPVRRQMEPSRRDGVGLRVVYDGVGPQPHSTVAPLSRATTPASSCCLHRRAACRCGQT